MRLRSLADWRRNLEASRQDDPTRRPHQNLRGPRETNIVPGQVTVSESVNRNALSKRRPYQSLLALHSLIEYAVAHSLNHSTAENTGDRRS